MGFCFAKADWAVVEADEITRADSRNANGNNSRSVRGQAKAGKPYK